MLSATTDPQAALKSSDVALVTVGTPSREDGSLDTSAVFRVMDEIGRSLCHREKPLSVALRSTVLPGTTCRCRERISTSAGKAGDKLFEIVFNPEFMREGSAIKDFENPPYTIVGAEDSDLTVTRLRELYGSINAGFHVVPLPLAEMLKYANNSFHAAKVVFANEIARLGGALGVDAKEVMKFVCMDKRLNISSRYLEPGFAFGGSCLPKDLRAITCEGKRLNVNVPMLESLMCSNDEHIKSAVRMIAGMGKKHVGILGISFKGSTDDVRESPVIELMRQLMKEGFELQAYDPNICLDGLLGANLSYLEQRMPQIRNVFVRDAGELVKNSEVIVVGNSNPEFAELLAELPSGKVVVDLNGCVREAVATDQYHAHGWFSTRK
jgi:GDP-mannose 6-dehydrogenase